MNGITANVGDNRTFYSILGCKQDATYEELKHSYQTLIKKYHPDKQNASNHKTDMFILIDKAFKTLKDVKLRKEYDASLLENRFNENCLIYDQVLKSDLKQACDEMKYPCRCGQNIVIPVEVLDEEESILECSECTNCILIK